MKEQEFIELNYEKNANFFVCASKGSIGNIIHDKVVNYTNFLPDKSPFKLRLYHYHNKLVTIPKCVCGSNLTHRKDKIHMNNPYTSYCSPKCRTSAGKVTRRKYSNDIQILLDKNSDWIYEQHITLKKGIETIFNEFKVSPNILKRYLKKYNIKHHDYRMTSPNILSKLKNYDLMFDMYITKRMKMSEISEELNSVGGTVSIWINKHGIDIRPNNSYDRENYKISKPEQSIVDYIKTIYDGDVKQSDRTLLGNGKEIDILIPEHNIAIEYNGLPWHTEYFGKKGKKYHLSKTEICESKGYNLLHIYSTEYESKPEIWKSVISSKLGKNERIYARKCDVVIISKSESNKFLDENHLQGKSNSNESVCMGLKYNDELVSVMTFSKSRFNKNVDWELVRFANKTFTNIIGGASRLLKHFQRNNSGSIVSYADRGHSMGSLYDLLGFERTNTNKPNYSYIKDGFVYSRQMFMKSKLKEKLNNFDENLTEKDNMLNNGYDLIWNCGTYTYIKT